MNIYLEKWKDAKRMYFENNTNFDSYELFGILQNWSKELKHSKDKIIRELYKLYLEKFESLEIFHFSNAHLDKSFKDILLYDYLEREPQNIQEAIIISRNLLWDIIAYKINKICPVCDYSEMRLLTNEAKLRIYICCDVCGYTTSDDDQKIENDIGVLIPADKSLIENYFKKISEKSN